MNKIRQKDKVEQALLVGMHGAPEWKQDEKAQYLGEFKERVIKKLTKEQVQEQGMYPEIFQALQEQRADRLIINGNIQYHAIEKYKMLATRCQKGSTVRSDPGFQGDTGLIVASDEAVDVEDITVENRGSRLARLGVPLALIEAAGQKVCSTCMSQITEADEQEQINYRRLTWLDRLSGDRCPVHK